MYILLGKGPNGCCCCCFSFDNADGFPCGWSLNGRAAFCWADFVPKKSLNMLVVWAAKPFSSLLTLDRKSFFAGLLIILSLRWRELPKPLLTGVAAVFCSASAACPKDPKALRRPTGRLTESRELPRAFSETPIHKLISANSPTCNFIKIVHDFECKVYKLLEVRLWKLLAWHSSSNLQMCSYWLQSGLQGCEKLPEQTGTPLLLPCVPGPWSIV